jgi:hypothetical protein
LGSVPMPPEVDDRLAFWHRLHDRLANLEIESTTTCRRKFSVRFTPAFQW